MRHAGDLLAADIRAIDRAVAVDDERGTGQRVVVEDGQVQDVLRADHVVVGRELRRSGRTRLHGWQAAPGPTSAAVNSSAVLIDSMLPR